MNNKSFPLRFLPAGCMSAQWFLVSLECPSRYSRWILQIVHSDQLFFQHQQSKRLRPEKHELRTKANVPVEVFLGPPTSSMDTHNPLLTPTTFRSVFLCNSESTNWEICLSKRCIPRRFPLFLRLLSVCECGRHRMNGQSTLSALTQCVLSQSSELPSEYTKIKFSFPSSKSSNKI